MAVAGIPFILRIKPQAGQNLIKGRTWPASRTLDMPDLRHLGNFYKESMGQYFIICKHQKTI